MATAALRNLNHPACPANAVYFKGFPVGTNEMFIKVILAQYGTIKGFFVNKKTNGITLGHGFAEYESSDKCDLAIKELNDTIKFGKQINVSKYGRNEQKAEPEFTSIFVANRPACPANAAYFKGFTVGTHEMFIKGIFAQYGTIKGFFVNKGTNDSNLGHGFVEYESSDKCDLAIKELNDTIKFGKQINVSKYGRNEQKAKAEPEFTSIFVGNILGVIDDEISLKQIFMGFGEITATTILRDEDGNSKGFGIVYFRNAADAKSALEANGALISPGKFLKVKPNEPKSKCKPSLKADVKSKQKEAGSSHQFSKNARNSGKGRQQKTSGLASMAKLSKSMPSLNIAEKLRNIPMLKIEPLNQPTASIDIKPKFQRFSSETQTPSESYREVLVKNFGNSIQTDDQLRELFQRFGKISAARLIKDERHQSGDFGFITFYNNFSAKKAIESLNGIEYKGNILTVVKARNKESRNIDRQKHFRQKFLTRFNNPQTTKCEPSKRSVFVKNALNTECNICLTENKASDCILLVCKHIICKDCIVHYIGHLVKNKEVESILCPKNDCESELTFDLIRELIPRELLDDYDRCLLDNYLDKCEDIMWCPKSDCRCPVYLSGNLPSLADCPKCNSKFCTNCGESYHGISPCYDFESEAQRMEVIDRYMNGDAEEKANIEKRYTKKKVEKEVEEHLSSLVIKQECKQCPSCKVNIQKYEGCNKMICAKCKVFFCWLCFELLDKTQPYGHFNNSVKCQLFAVPDELR